MIIHCTADDLLVTATEPEPGLFVYEIPEAAMEDPWLPWGLGVRSGFLVTSFPSEQAAIAAAEDISPIADWSASLAELRALFLNHRATSDHARRFLLDGITSNGGCLRAALNERPF